MRALENAPRSYLFNASFVQLLLRIPRRECPVHLFQADRNVVGHYGSHSNYKNYHRTHARECLNNFRAFRALATSQQIFNLPRAPTDRLRIAPNRTMHRNASRKQAQNICKQSQWSPWHGVRSLTLFADVLISYEFAPMDIIKIHEILTTPFSNYCWKSKRLAGKRNGDFSEKQMRTWENLYRRWYSAEETARDTCTSLLLLKREMTSHHFC